MRFSREPIDRAGVPVLSAVGSPGRDAHAGRPIAGFHGMVGQSPAMRRLFAQIPPIAAAAGSVLIIGETGTGKELIARAIHGSGPRAAGPFVAVNCAALPRDLVESELFGHVRGAFSGATMDHLGLVRAAAGGTLLLDEITEMAPALQAKLLRVLQERSVRPVGGVRELRVDLRVIASTNRDPAEALTSGALRSDLYYRLCTNRLEVAPLRDRREDIGDLIDHHLSVLNEQHRDTLPYPRGITPRAVALLAERPWPGNVRELFNAVESAFIGADGSLIDAEELAPAVAVFFPPERHGAGETLADSERALILRTLLRTGGNKRRSAQLLGISRKKLYAKLAKYSG